MSHPVRRVLAALGLAAILLFAVPAPSRAAGLREVSALIPGVVARIRTWAEGWLPGPRRAALPRGAKQGSGVDPNGNPLPTTSPAPGSRSSQGSGVDPNGVQ
jgi:hypothetical protein